jgi:hypothetical protein
VVAGSTNVVNSTAIKLVVVEVGTLVACKPAGAFGRVLAAVVMRLVSGHALSQGNEFGKGYCVWRRYFRKRTGGLFGSWSASDRWLLCFGFCSNLPGAAWTAARSVPALAKEVEVA